MIFRFKLDEVTKEMRVMAESAEYERPRRTPEFWQSVNHYCISNQFPLDNEDIRGAVADALEFMWRVQDHHSNVRPR